MNKDHFIFVRCFNENACLQGNAANPLSHCEEGYRGIMCTSCDNCGARSNEVKSGGGMEELGKELQLD